MGRVAGDDGAERHFGARPGRAEQLLRRSLRPGDERARRLPVPEGPLYSAAEARAQTHIRAEKGTTCHYYGRCRLPNAYLYDKEIIPRVATFIRRDGRFEDTSVWIIGQRRWVYLQGCVSTQEQKQQLEAEIRLIDDVEAVIDELMVGTASHPSYREAAKDRK